MNTQNRREKSTPTRQATGEAAVAVLREEAFVRECREERIRRGWSQRELARRLADRGLVLHQSSIAKMERVGHERRPVALAEAMILSDVFGIPVAPWLFKGMGGETDTLAALAAENRKQRSYIEQMHRWLDTIPPRGGDL